MNRPFRQEWGNFLKAFIYIYLDKIYIAVLTLHQQNS